MLQIVGAGAVGTVVAGFLSAAGHPVRLICRQAEVPALRSADRIIVDRVTGGPPIVAPKPLLATEASDAPDSVVLICVKYPDLDSVLDALRGHIHDATLLVSLLNGVGAVRRIRERFPEQPAAAAGVLFNAQLLEPLHARITTRPQLLLPEHPALNGLFAGSGIRTIPAQEKIAWGKLLINLGNAIGALTHTTFRDLVSEDDLRVVYAAAIEEGARTLTRAGIAFELPLHLSASAYGLLLRRGGALPWWLAKWRNGLSEGSYPSMVSDLDHGRPTEVDALNGEIVALARRCSETAPVNEGLCRLVHEGEAQRDRYRPMAPAALRARLPIDD